MSILLVRHGQTWDNASATIQHPNSALSNNGRLQAQRLAQRLEQRDISKIICSDYQRTQETAEPIASVLGVEPSLSSLLRERNFGDLRGRSYSELSFDPFAQDYAPPNGESWHQFLGRVARAWNDVVTLAASERSDLLVMTHGFVCHALVVNHVRLNAGMNAPSKWGNTSLTLIDKAPPWGVSLLNCTDHLFSNSTNNEPHSKSDGFA